MPPIQRSTSCCPFGSRIHDQQFTKTSHCWGQENNVKGTNTNRMVVFRKEP
jgi:hypothetical protein